VFFYLSPTPPPGGRGLKKLGGVEKVKVRIIPFIFVLVVISLLCQMISKV
jgi:hypothetical protein